MLFVLKSVNEESTSQCKR